MLPEPATPMLFSSLIRRISELGGYVSPFVPPAASAFMAR